MPIYPCKCECGHYEEPLLKAADYKKLPKHCGKKMKRVFTPLHVIEDMKPYKSPLDGSIVGSRSEHRAHMSKHGVIEVGNEKLNRPASKTTDVGGLKQDIAQAIAQSTK